MEASLVAEEWWNLSWSSRMESELGSAWSFSEELEVVEAAWAVGRARVPLVVHVRVFVVRWAVVEILLAGEWACGGVLLIFL